MNMVAFAGMAVVAFVTLLVGWLVGRNAAKAQVERLCAERDTLMADRVRYQTQAEVLQDLTGKQKVDLDAARGQADEVRQQATRLQAQVEEAQRSVISERELLADARRQLTDTFKSLAGDILKENNAQFLGIANRELSAKEESIEKLLSPVRETLVKMEGQTQRLENERAKAYTEVLTEIRNVQKTHETLRMETTQLVQALRAPKARGNWGELQLKRCIEFSGMVEHCSFDTEVFLRATEDPAQRPDVVVQLPNGRAIIIDAKTPLDAYLSAMSATDEIQRTAYLKAHATQVRTHLSQLGEKQYWQRFHNSPDFVVCFLPSEVLFSAALEQDPSLIEFGSQANVILATPTTLIALLKAVAYGWQQMEITRNAIAICEAGESLYKKLAGTQKYFASLGNALNKSVEQFNKLAGAVEGPGSVFSLASKLHRLGIGQEKIADIAPVDLSTRTLQSDHWDEPIALAASEETSEE
jgi:DNA recombination protein RmuC